VDIQITVKKKEKEEEATITHLESHATNTQ